MSKMPVNILLVEDDEIDRECLVRLVKKLDLPTELSFACDGIEAVAMLSQVSQTPMNPPPDIVFLDVNMPKMNGFEVLSALSQENLVEKLNTFMLTTSEREHDIEGAHAYPISSYLTKPITLEKLQSIIGDCSHE